MLQLFGIFPLKVKVEELSTNKKRSVTDGKVNDKVKNIVKTEHSIR
jgi:hypothetical protein